MSRQSRSDVTRLWGSLNPHDAPATRDALLQYLPAIINRWADVAATVSADWYVDQRHAYGVRGSFTPTPAASLADEFIEKRIRFGVSTLWEGEPSRTLDFMRGIVDQYALNAGRHTIADAAEADPAAAQWRRVLGGSTECDFCQGLARRTFTPGNSDEGRTFHPYDGCVAVPVFT